MTSMAREFIGVQPRRAKRGIVLFESLANLLPGERLRRRLRE